MSAITVRLPESLHRAVREMAKKEGVSINQFITLALAEKIAALATEEYLEARAQRASRARFEEALAKVPDTAPPEWDQV